MSDTRMATEIFMQWLRGHLTQMDTSGNLDRKRLSGHTLNSLFQFYEARLHIFDGNGLKQYRLVHETWADQTESGVQTGLQSLL